MRTREEQIAALAFKIGGVQASNATQQSAEAHIHEAERRAEQRVRAEITVQEGARLSRSGNAYANAEFGSDAARNGGE
ncbi:hypothetical protein [Acetobacter malorum]|uniref:hypothetical protein n=1 Tax=Acetobacter malorum TaxID=178901 RepID=UPI0039EBA5B7